MNSCKHCKKKIKQFKKGYNGLCKDCFKKHIQVSIEYASNQEIEKEITKGLNKLYNDL